MKQAFNKLSNSQSNQKTALIVAGAATAVSLAASYLIIRKRQEAAAYPPYVPGPKGKPLVGSIPDMRRDTLETMHSAWRAYGDICHMRLGPNHLTVVSHPDLADEILVKGQHKFLKPGAMPPGDPLSLAVGNGLLTNADPVSWRTQRRMMQPLFHKRSIAAMGSKMTTAGERLLAHWEADFQPGQAIDVDVEMRRVTLDVINQTMFSADVVDDVDRIGPAMTTAVHYTFSRIQNPLMPPPNWPTRTNRRFQSALHTLDEIVMGLIQARRAAGDQYDDLLDMLLQARDEETGQGMSDTELRDEVLTIFGAGHETTANALNWTWFMLSENFHVLRCLQEEVDRVLNGRSPTLDDLPDLPYTMQVFEESLRHYPPVIAVPRVAMQETTLRGYRIPAGSTLAVNIYNIHHHPDFWRKPYRFDPERFTSEQKQNRPRLAYLPFGAGPRICIGANFAMAEGPLLLALIAQRYELRLVPGHPVAPEIAITMRPRYGMQMTLHPRQ